MSKNENSIYCFSYFQAKAAHRDELIHALLQLITPTRAEPGCIQYVLLVDQENPLFLIMFEHFCSLKDLQEHEQQPYVQFFVDQQMNQFCEKVSWHVASVVESK